MILIIMDSSEKIGPTLMAMVGQVPVGIIKITLDCQIIRANDIIAQILGIPAGKELVGSNLGERLADPKPFQDAGVKTP